MLLPVRSTTAAPHLVLVETLLGGDLEEPLAQLLGLRLGPVVGLTPAGVAVGLGLAGVAVGRGGNALRLGRGVGLRTGRRRSRCRTGRRSCGRPASDRP